jgi:hypothetical protein
VRPSPSIDQPIATSDERAHEATDGANRKHVVPIRVGPLLGCHAYQDGDNGANHENNEDIVSPMPGCGESEGGEDAVTGPEGDGDLIGELKSIKLDVVTENGTKEALNVALRDERSADFRTAPRLCSAPPLPFRCLRRPPVRC